MKTVDEQFEAVSRLLSSCRGKARAMTIAQIRAAAGLPNRRACEDLLETRLADFPFPLCAGGSGYYIPTTANEINRYLDSLKGRCFALYRRHRIEARKALAWGFRRVGNRFENPPSHQPELFEMEAAS